MADPPSRPGYPAGGQDDRWDDVSEVLDLMGLDLRDGFLAEMLTFTSDFVSLLDEEGTIVYVNRVDTRHRLEDVVGQPVVQMVVPADRGRLQSALQDVLGARNPTELSVCGLSGRTLRVRLSPLIRKDRVLGALVIGTDQGNQRNHQLQQERLSMILEGSGMGQWTWNVATNQVVWDENTKRIYGFDLNREDISYEDVLAATHPADRDFAHQHVQTALKTGHYAPVEIRILVDGEVRWIQSMGRVVKDAEGRPTDFLGAITDISQERRRREKMKQAERLETMGRLAGTVAHDFNNLLVALLGNLELARTEEDERERTALLAEATEVCERGADLTRRLLAFSQREPVQCGSLELNPFLLEMERLLTRLLPESVVLTVELPPEAWWIRADPGQLQHVVINLALNARDALPEATGHVSLTARLSPDDETWVMLEVRDSGEGIQPDQLEQIFEPFFTTRLQGTGLGLASVRDRMREQGGEVAVSSTLGVGSVFQLFLPRTQPDPSVASPAFEASRPITPAGRGRTLLVAEDQPEVRKTVCRVLEQGGFRVLEAADGAEAKDLFIRASPQIEACLLDVRMPRVSGFDVASFVQAHNPRIPVVLTSGYTEGFDPSTWLGAGPERFFLQKPYEPRELLDLLRHALSSVPSGRPA